LTVEPFRHESGGHIIDASAMKVWLEELVYLPRGNASVNGTAGGYKWNINAISHVGWHPDPLMPWRPIDILAGEQRAAWINVRVPSDSPAGTYNGKVTATSRDGVILKLNVTLEVFDFQLPRSRRFVPALGVDIKGALPPGAELNQVALDIAKLLAERNMAPWTYGQRHTSYYVPWKFNAKKNTGEFDFKRMDRALKILINDYDLRYLFFKFHPPFGSRPGYVYDSSNQFVRGDTEQGRQMLTVWLTAITHHLKEKGWLDRAYFYIADEVTRSNDTTVHELGKLVRTTGAGMKTWALSAILGDWWTHMEQTDVFGGPISEDNLKRFKAMGGEWWGSYNRTWLIGSPLWNPRIIALDSYSMGATGYAQWAATRWQNQPWVNGAYTLRLNDKNARQGLGSLIFGTFAPGMDNMIYPWPSFEGAPERGDRPTVVPSIRLEALAEGIDDYEYAMMLEDLKGDLPGEEALEAQQLLDELRSIVAAGRLGGDFTHHADTYGVFMLDGELFTEWRVKIGRFLAAHLRQ